MFESFKFKLILTSTELCLKIKSGEQKKIFCNKIVLLVAKNKLKITSSNVAPDIKLILSNRQWCSKNSSFLTEKLCINLKKKIVRLI